ncbi:hypothetical protein Pcinc_006772 [Petrolisthes cinctipes]|uniref:Ig-like domain-containing protein n=1 Tax=Petrolisthes cinctipes TaxID=88211 RepID=A0AAE1GCA6_PETCI|nr:hypothetical protein Pcinc_006772 [Petrolisthes cinctipes]
MECVSRHTAANGVCQPPNTAPPTVKVGSARVVVVSGDENCHQYNQPVSAEVLAVVGQEVKLSCKVIGHSSRTLTWTRPDQGPKPVTSSGCQDSGIVSPWFILAG